MATLPNRLKTNLVEALPLPVKNRLRRIRGKYTKKQQKQAQANEAQKRRKAIAEALENPIWKNSVLFESFDGQGALCNPRAIFDRMYELDRFRRWKFIWVAAEGLSTEFKHRLPNHSNITIVERKSAEYFKALHSTEYVITNSTFPPEYTKRRDQVYLNTWHGVPLKKMGFDAPDGRMNSRNVLRNFLAADYLLSSNQYMTETMYKGAFKLDGIASGKVIEAGTPRIDKQFTDAKSRNDLISRLRSENISFDPELPTVVYAPTWKGGSVYSPANSLNTLKSVVKATEEHLGSNRVNFLIKAHQLVFQQGSEDPELEQILIPNGYETNAILSLADILITDYSSIFFDFLACDRPILFHTPDSDGYLANRGLYFKLSELPGKVTKSNAELAEAIAECLSKEAANKSNCEHKDRRTDWKKKFADLEDGRATDRVINEVFSRYGSESSSVYSKPLEHDKIRILLYPGGLRNNGITRSALNFLNNIDLNLYDITLTFGFTKDSDKLDNISQLDSRIRFMPRVGRTLTAPQEEPSYRRFLETGRVSSGEKNIVNRIFEREWRRSFGSAEFDFVFDFDGYSAFQARLLSSNPRGVSCIWAHSDMRRDSERTVKGVKVFAEKFNSIF